MSGFNIVYWGYSSYFPSIGETHGKGGAALLHPTVMNY